MAEAFAKLPKAILARADLTPAAKIVFAVLQDRQGANGKSWPGERRLAADCGLGLGTVCACVRQLEAAGLVAVDRRGRGKGNHYRIAPGKCSDSERLEAAKCSDSEQGVRKSERKRSDSERNQTDPITRPKGAAAPPLELTPPKAAPSGNGAAGRLTTAWAEGFRRRGLEFRNARRVGGTFKTLLKRGYPEMQLAPAVNRWFRPGRADYGIGLFVSKLDGASVELTGRSMAADEDPIALANGRALAQAAEAQA